MKKSRTSRPRVVVESPVTRTLALVDLLLETKAELFELMVRSGLRVLDAMLEEDRAVLCGVSGLFEPRNFERYSVVSSADLLFQIVTRRYEQKSIVLTTNLAFRDGWNGSIRVPRPACAKGSRRRSQ